MATVIKRSDGRIEIRESLATARGPRSRTLAIARELTDEVIEHAAERARKPIDRDELIERAGRLGVHLGRRTQADVVARLVERVRADALWPTHAKAIQTVLRDVEHGPLPHHLEAMTEWMGTDDGTRGNALVDLLKLSEATMQHYPESQRAREPLRFPSLRHCRR